MIGAVLCAVAFAAALVLGRRRTAWGVTAVAAAGYAYGIVRAQLLDGASHFIFDAAVLGLYAAMFTRSASPEERARSRLAGAWTRALFALPVVMFFVPLQHPLIQLVGLRAAVLFLPMILVGSRLRADELVTIGRALAALNLIAFAFAVGEYVLGVEPFFPRNGVTDLIYRSTDVGSEGAFRIPATFPNAHAYAGTMLASLPFLLAPWHERRTASPWNRLLLAGALVATPLGIFASGARTPVLMLFGIGPVILLARGVPGRARAALIALALVLAVFVARSERFQRFTTVADVGMVERRFQGSNLKLADVAVSYPLGAGLGRASGTSIPFFLSHLAEPQIGLENEYSRIVVDQGILGVVLWVMFVVWTIRREVPLPDARWALMYRVARVHVALSWLVGLIGTGLLLSIPQSALMLLQMGLLAASAPPRPARSSPEAAWARHWGRAA